MVLPYIWINSLGNFYVQGSSRSTRPIHTISNITKIRSQSGPQGRFAWSSKFLPHSSAKKPKSERARQTLYTFLESTTTSLSVTRKKTGTPEKISCCLHGENDTKSGPFLGFIWLAEYPGSRWISLEDYNLRVCVGFNMRCVHTWTVKWKFT